MVILLQGAMNEEIDVFIENYKPYETKNINGYDFYISDYKNHTIIVSKTNEGIINATIATLVAIKEFAPDIVINQGCAGGHTLQAKQGCIIIGEKAIYINDFKSIHKDKGEGSNSLDWIPNAKRSYEIYSTKKLLDIAKETDKSENVFVGVLGSGDMLSREYDRIVYLNSLFHEDCEDMESAAVFKVCEVFNIDRIALRVISNNELLLQEMDKNICRKMQYFVIKFIDKVLVEY